jgi:hypothetical protein
MFLLNGKPLALDVAFRTPDGTQYPNNWLRLASPESREAIGITESADPPTWDQRFYWGYDADGNLIPKDHTQLVTQWSEQTRTTAGTLLSPTDWMIIREADNDTPIPADIKTARQNTRVLCHHKVNTIGITTTTPELATYVTSPDYSSWNAPYPSWTLNSLTVQWEAPVVKPELTEEEVLAGSSYVWDEETLDWILETPDALAS